MKNGTKTLLALAGVLALAGAVTAAALLLPRSGSAADAGDRLDAYIRTALAEPPENDGAGASIESEILEHMSYTVTARAESSATLSVTAPDMGALIDEMMARGGSKEEGEAFLLAALQNGEFDTATTEVAVELDENGAPVDSFAFADAMYGGLLTKMDELLGEAAAG